MVIGEPHSVVVADASSSALHAKGVTAEESRWRERPVLSWTVRALAVILPVAVSIVAARLTADVLPDDAGPVAWWVSVVGVSLLVLVVVDNGARRALPLAALLKLSLAFPDQAPSRLGVALRAGSPNQLRRRAEDAAARHDTQPAEAARTILALAATIGAHDRATRGHSERVRAYAELIATELKLEAPDRDRLRWAALLHDVGKLSVPAHTLNTHEPLTDEEWETLKRHPEEGARLASPLEPWLGPWVMAIAEHHERFDGRGYPRGLEGHAISTAARIVAVADSYDAMTSIRSYNDVMTPFAARQELARKAGTDFDPDIVRAFLNVSIGKLRWVTGPAALIAGTPLVIGLNQLQRAFGAATRTAALSVMTVAATVGVASVVVPHHPSVLRVFSPHQRPRPGVEIAAAAPDAAQAPPDEQPSLVRLVSSAAQGLVPFDVPPVLGGVPAVVSAVTGPVAAAVTAPQAIAAVPPVVADPGNGNGIANGLTNGNGPAKLSPDGTSGTLGTLGTTSPRVSRPTTARSHAHRGWSRRLASSPVWRNGEPPTAAPPPNAASHPQNSGHEPHGQGKGLSKP